MFCNFRTPTAVDGESLASLTDQSESESEEVRSNGCYIYDIKNYIQDYWKIRTHYLYKLFAIISITSLLSPPPPQSFFSNLLEEVHHDYI